MTSLPIRAAGVIAALGALAAPVTAQETPAAHAAHGAPAVQVVTVTTTDYAFQLPDIIPAGATEFRLENQGREPHHLFLMRLDEGKTLADLVQVIEAHGPPPAWAHEVGGPNASMGAPANAVLVMTPGTYALLCMIPSPDGKPHVAKGMLRTLTVVPSDNPAALPPADLTLTLTDYGFQFDKPLTAGRHVIRVRNAAAQGHEVVIVRMEDGKRAEDFVSWVHTMQGPPPGALVGGTTGFAADVENQITLDLAPGTYGLVCFWPDKSDGKPHHEHGMLQTIAVK